MIIVLAMLIVIIALYVVLLEIRIKKIESDLKTQFKINSIFEHMLDIQHEQVDLLADVVGIGGKKNGK